jgi:hypothetical protein
MNGKGFDRKRFWLNLKQYPGVCLEGLKDSVKKPDWAQPVSQLGLQDRDILMHEMRMRDIETRTSTLSGEKRVSIVKYSQRKIDVSGNPN